MSLVQRNSNDALRRRQRSFDGEAGRSGQSIVVVLLVILCLAIISVGAVGLFQQQTDLVEKVVLQRRAASAAFAGFNAGLASLLDTGASLKDRFYAVEGKEFGVLSRPLDEGTCQFVVSDVYNRFSELETIFIVSRGVYEDRFIRPVGAVHFGCARAVASEDGVEAIVQLSEPLDVPTLLRLYAENEDLYRSEGNPLVKEGRITVPGDVYDANVDAFLALVREGRLDGVDFSDGEFAQSVVAFLHRHGELLVLYRLARRCLGLQRESGLAEVLRLAGFVHNSPDGLRAVIQAILRQGPPFDTTSVEGVHEKMSRSQLELFLILLLLERLQELPETLEITTDAGSGNGGGHPFRLVMTELLRLGLPDPGRLPLLPISPVIFRGNVDRADILAGRTPPWFTQAVASDPDGRSPFDYFVQRSISSLDMPSAMAGSSGEGTGGSGSSGVSRAEAGGSGGSGGTTGTNGGAGTAGTIGGYGGGPQENIVSFITQTYGSVGEDAFQLTATLAPTPYVDLMYCVPCRLSFPLGTMRCSSCGGTLVR